LLKKLIKLFDTREGICFMKNYFIAAVCVTGLLTTGCSAPQGNNETGGMIAGGLAGGIIGSQFGSGAGAVLGAGIGAVAAGFAGKEIGKSMDEKERSQS
jgi:uncharacterized protein YcfJ